MADKQSDFFDSILSELGYTTKQDIIENLFIKSLRDTYLRIDKTIGNENEIRDRFMKDLYKTDSEIRKWLQMKYIDLIWENWVFTPDFELARTDIAFKMTGLHFIIECKRLKIADKAYIDEGLERFINLKYAEGDDFAGMIGFVIDGDKEVICLELKDRIKHLSHIISVDDTKAISDFNSCHSRTDRTEIDIYHLFMDFKLNTKGL